MARKVAVVTGAGRGIGRAHSATGYLTFLDLRA